MKNLKIKFGLFSLLAVLAVSVFMISCEQEGIVSSIQEEFTTDENHRIMDVLCNDVNDCDDIEIFDDAIIIDKCSHMDKDNFIEYLTMLENGVEEEPVMSRVPHPLAPNKMIEIPIKDIKYYNEQNSPIIDERQKIFSVLQFAKNSKVSNLKYFIHQSAFDCHANNQSAINDATAYWTSVSNCRVSFSATGNINSADIVFGCDSDPNYRSLSGHGEISSDAKATAPNLSTRAVGKYISINDAFTSDTNLRKGLMIHEIGHCLGLYHTNFSGGYHLYDSPTTDVNSIMNSTVNTNSLSTHDRKMVRRLWPNSLSKPTNVSFQKAGGSVRIRLKNPNVGTKPYNHLNVGHWYNGSYQPWGNWGHQADASGNYDIWWIQYFAPGRHYFYVQGGSHNNEVLSTYSGWYYVDM